MRHIFTNFRSLFFLLVLLLSFFPKTTAFGSRGFSIELESEGRYPIQPGVSDEFAAGMALYEAKRKAVEMAARYLARRNLIPVYDGDREEVFSLTARKIKTNILEKEKRPGKNRSIFIVRIGARIQPFDYIHAEIAEKELEERDHKKHYLQEMEPRISEAIDPGKDIAEAYRLVHEKKWRMALIYLGRLEEKYPGWAEIYTVKALGYYALNDTFKFNASLKKACLLGDESACRELKSFKKIHDSWLLR